MMPEHIHPDDVRWFKQITMGLPYRYRVKACIGYGAAYKEAYDAETRPTLYKENAARYAANTRLNHYLRKIERTK